MVRWALVALVVSSVAVAEPTPRSLFEEGAGLFEQGAFEPAAEKFEASFALRPIPVTKFNAARSWEKAGRTLKAIDAWQAVLEMSADAAQRSEAEQALSVLGQKLARQGVQALTITSLPAQARVTIDGTLRGLTPVTVELVPTRHLVRLDLDGREPVERTLDFTLESARVERFELAPLGQAQPRPMSPPPLGPLPLPAPEIPRRAQAPVFATGGLLEKVVQVHLAADDSETRLYRMHGNPAGECRTPCDVPIRRADDQFYVAGSNITASKPFVLSDHARAGQASLRVKTGSATMAYLLGTSLVSAGVVGSITGSVLLALPGGDRALALISLGGGIAALVGGILAFALNATTVTFVE